MEENSRALAGRAADRLAAAGQRAFGQGDMPAAATLLWRAAALYPSHDPRRMTLLLPLGRALVATDAPELGETVLQEAVEFGDPPVAAEARVALRWARAHGTRDAGPTR